VNLPSVSNSHKTNEVAVSVRGLGLTYTTAIDRRPTLKARVKSLGRGGKQTRVIRALDEVNLDVEYGQVLGIIGTNGAGKSSLMRVILIVDEALSTGDAKFKEKSLNRIKELRSDDRALILVSHAMATLEDVCNDVAWLHKGKLVQRGDPKTVIAAYREFLQVGKSAAIDEDV